MEIWSYLWLTATSLLGSFRFAGGSIALAIYGSIISNKIATSFGPEVAGAVIEAGLAPANVGPFIGRKLSSSCRVSSIEADLDKAAFASGIPTEIGAVPGVTPAIIAAAADAAKSVYAAAFQRIFLVGITFGCKYKPAMDYATALM